jgi:hypothetical protein
MATTVVTTSWKEIADVDEWFGLQVIAGNNAYLAAGDTSPASGSLGVVCYRDEKISRSIIPYGKVWARAIEGTSTIVVNVGTSIAGCNLFWE